MHDAATLFEQTEEERQRAARAAETAGVSAFGADTSEIDRRAAEFATAQVDYIYEQQPDEIVPCIAAEVYRR